MMFNTELARKVLMYIHTHPEQHDQDHYADPEDDDLLFGGSAEVVSVAEGVKPKNGKYRCLTTACIAGWAVVLAGPEAVREAWAGVESKDRDDEWFETGMALLGMTREEAAAVFLDFDEASALERLETMIAKAEGEPMTYDPLRPIGPIDRIITVEEAQRQAQALMDKIVRANEQAVPPGNRPDDARPLGYVVLLRQNDDTWDARWDGEVHETRQRVLEELRAARRSEGYDNARAAVLYPLEEP